MANLILLAIILGPVILLTLLRVSSALVYLSLCLGYVLSQFVGNDSSITNFISTSKITSKVASHISTTPDVRIGLLVLPAILTTLFMIKSAKGKKISLEIIPALATGLLLVYLLVPLLPFSTTASIATSQIWMQLRNYQVAVIGIGSAIVLVLMLIKRPKHHNNKHGKEK